MAKRVLFLGGGPCTLVALRRLREGPPEMQKEIDVTIITNDEWHYFPPLFADLALNDLTVEQIRAPVKNIAKRYNANLIIDEVTKVEPANRVVKTKSGREFSYDYLFVCLGVKNYPDAIPGLKEHGYHNYSLDGALAMREALAKFNGREIAILTPETPYRCGCYPFEVAGKVKYFAQRKGRDVKVKLVHVMSKQQMLQQFKDVARQFFKIHEKLGIEYVDGVKVERVEKGRIITQGGDAISYDLLIYVPPVRVPDALKGSGLEKNEKVLETTFPTFKSKKYDDVFIPTDSAMPSVGLPIAGIFMHPAAIAAADMLISELTGVRATPPYPENVVAATDFGPTGLMVSFDVRDNGDGTASQKMYVTLNSPVVKYLKLAFYLGWINSLK